LAGRDVIVRRASRVAIDPSHRQPLSLNAMVASVAETPGQESGYRHGTVQSGDRLGKLTADDTEK